MPYANPRRLRRKKFKSVEQFHFRLVYILLISHSFNKIQNHSQYLQSINKKDITSPKSNSIIPVNKLPGTTGITRLTLYLCHLTSDICYQTSVFRHLTSDVWHHTSVIKCLLSDIFYQTSHIKCRFSDTCHQTSYLCHETSYIRCLLSDTCHQTSDISHLLSDNCH